MVDKDSIGIVEKKYYTLKETVEEEDSIMAELTEFFLSDLSVRLEKFNDDVQKKNKNEVTRFGHSLKGTGGSYGFPEFSKIGSDIEQAGRDGYWGKIATLQKKLNKEFKLIGE